jgi:hypothetical protein
MFLQDFENIINTLSYNCKMVHNIRSIYSFISGEALSDQEEFESWFAWVVDELELVEAIHYLYREAGDINSVFVSGTVGLNMLLAADNNLGRMAQIISGTDRVEIIGLIPSEHQELAPTTMWTCP